MYATYKRPLQRQVISPYRGRRRNPTLLESAQIVEQRCADIEQKRQALFDHYEGAYDTAQKALDLWVYEESDEPKGFKAAAKIKALLSDAITALSFYEAQYQKYEALKRDVKVQAKLLMREAENLTDEQDPDGELYSAVDVALTEALDY